MQVKDILLLTDKRYGEIEDECGVEFGYLQNRRYKLISKMPVDIVIKLAEVLDVNVSDLLAITKDDIKQLRSIQNNRKILLNK